MSTDPPRRPRREPSPQPSLWVFQMVGEITNRLWSIIHYLTRLRKYVINAKKRQGESTRSGRYGGPFSRTQRGDIVKVERSLKIWYQIMERCSRGESLLGEIMNLSFPRIPVQRPLSSPEEGDEDQDDATEDDNEDYADDEDHDHDSTGDDTSDDTDDFRASDDADLQGRSVMAIGRPFPMK